MKKSIVLILLIGFVTIISSAFKKVSTEDENLLKIALEYKTYETYNRSDLFDNNDSLRFNWTIALCVDTRSQKEMRFYKHDSLFFSKADSVNSLHGNKLYRLYLKDAKSYFKGNSIPQPVGQVLVKETYNVVQVSKDSVSKNDFAVQSRRDLKWYKPTTVSQLFIMYKEEENANNDKGWVYGIVDIENKRFNPKVLNVGKISSCIGCHKDTKYDRIFGHY